MKWLALTVSLIHFSAFAAPSTASIHPPAQETQALLAQMRHALDAMDYELSYILVRKNNIEPLRLRQALIDGKHFRQVVHLTGPSREVLKRGNYVSYFESGIEPFTIESDRMVAPLPAIFDADIHNLAEFYNFVPLGRAREAGLSCEVVRISPKGGERYSYVIWIDQASKLLLRADLLDRDGEPIEQFRTIAMRAFDAPQTEMTDIAALGVPEALAVPDQPQVAMSWEVTNLPDGFQSVYKNRHRLFMTGRMVESQMFSDGLFNFSVYLSNADSISVQEQLARKGRRTLHTQVNQGIEITVVGDIPPATAKKVAASIRFHAPLVIPQPTDVQR